MPYIAPEGRNRLQIYLTALSEMMAQDEDFAGDFNFIICTLANEHLNRVGIRYKNLNRIIGALECSKLEIYRRVAAEYEDAKAEQNGDLFGVEPSN